MRPADVEATAALSVRCFAAPYDRSQLEVELARDIALVLVATAEERTERRVDGYAIFWRVGDAAELLQIAVDPDRRGAGIGRALMETALEQLTAAGARSVHLEVRRDNVPARRLYDRLGFASTSVRAGYYADGEDALVMARTAP